MIQALDEISGGRSVVLYTTVVTDLCSAHLSWFDPRADSIFVPNEKIRALARQYGVIDEHIHDVGLPVREHFWEPDPLPKSERRALLGLPNEEGRKIALVMGGGDGAG